MTNEKELSAEALAVEEALRENNANWAGNDAQKWAELEEAHWAEMERESNNLSW